MSYRESIEKLNSADPDTLENELQKLSEMKNLSLDEWEDRLKNTIGMLFGASKEYKVEELYRVIKNDQKPPERFEKLWNAENSPFEADELIFYSDPITPFLDMAVVPDEKISLLTYRKAVEENPLLLLTEGLPDDSKVFEILKKDGLSDAGADNYRKISGFIRKKMQQSEKVFSFIAAVRRTLESDEPADAFEYEDASGASHVVIKAGYAAQYYICTSSIFCRLDSIDPDGENVRIEPLQHNKEPMLPGKEIAYDDFGEIGCFTFEKNDYE